MPDDPRFLAAGTIVNDRYQIVQLIGHGGMGAIYEATDERLGNTIALKQTLMAGKRLTQAFEREARLLAALRHPALPVVSDYFVDPYGQFLVMQHIPGDDLQMALERRRKPFPLAQVGAWADQLLDVLEYLHGHAPPIVHRDIKPQNLKLGARGEIVLLDFGLAKGNPALALGEADDRSIFGYTPTYAPPEQAKGEGTDPRSDLYALAATLYHLLSCQAPAKALIRLNTMATGAPDPLQALHAISSDVPAAFAQALHAALSLHIGERPRSATALRNQLRGALRGSPLFEAAPPPESVTTQAAEDAETEAAEAAGERRVLYDVNERRRSFLNLVDQFGDVTRSEQLRKLLGRELVAQMREQERLTRERLETPFTLVVMGDFKRGKSTLVNALLGRQIVTSNVTPETITINRLTYGPTLSVHAYLSDGGKVRLSPDEIAAERIEPLIGQLPNNVQYLTIEAPVEWLRGLMLVDVPGTGDLDWHFDQQVQHYLPEADAILYTISALAPLSASEQAFLRLAIAPQAFPKLIFVVNMIDAIRNEHDVDRVLALMQNRVETIFPQATLFGISALDELCRLQSRSRPNPRRADRLTESFRTFRNALEDSILLHRHTIQIDRATALFEDLIQTFETAVQRLTQAVERDQSQLQAAIGQCEDQQSALHRAIAQHRDDARSTIDALGNQAKRWMDEYLDRFERDVIDALPQHRMPSVQRHFHFFFSDTLANAINRCIEAHQPLIAAVLERMRTAIFEDVARSVEAPSGASGGISAITFKPSSWNSLDTLHWVSMFVQSSIFGFIGKLVTSGLMAVLEKNVDDPRQIQRYQQQLRDRMPELRERIRQELGAIYTDITTRVDSQIQEAYEADIAALLDTLRQAQQIHSQGAQQVQAVKSTCAEGITMIHETRQSLEAFQQSLWPEASLA